MTTNLNSIILKDNDEWFIAVALDHAAAIFYSKPVKYWCVGWKRSNSFYRHFHLWWYTFIFLTHKPSNKKWMMCISDRDGDIKVSGEKLADIPNPPLDAQITKEQFTIDTKLNIEEIKELVYDPNVISVVRKFRDDGVYEADLNKVHTTNPYPVHNKKIEGWFKYS
jgi:hypothetical protein